MSLKLNNVPASFHIDNFVWIMSKIDHVAMNMKKKDLDGLKMIPISSTIIRNEVGAKYREYIQYLIDFGIILCDEHYITTQSGGYGKCKCYSYTEKFETKALVDYYINKKSLVKRTNKWNALMMNSIKKDSTLSEIYERMTRTTIDIVKAKAYLSDKLSTCELTERAYGYELNKINRINDGDFRLSRDEYGRIHTNFTNLSKHIRENYIRIDGEEVVGVDIKSSQPATLYSMVTEFIGNGINRSYSSDINDIISYEMSDPRNKYVNSMNKRDNKILFSDSIYMNNPITYDNVGYFTRLSDEMNKYKEYLMSGIYELFRSEWKDIHKTEISLKNAKKKWYTFAFGRSYGKTYQKIKQVWFKQFPLLVDLIEKIKEGDHKKMAHMLQRRESRIVLGDLCSEVNESIDSGYFTVHDCIYLPKKQGILDKVCGIFSSVLLKNDIITGFSVS